MLKNIKNKSDFQKLNNVLSHHCWIDFKQRTSFMMVHKLRQQLRKHNCNRMASCFAHFTKNSFRDNYIPSHIVGVKCGSKAHDLTCLFWMHIFKIWNVFYLCFGLKLPVRNTQIANALSFLITAWVCIFLTGRGGGISKIVRRIALMQRRDKDDAHPISTYCQTSVAQVTSHTANRSLREAESTEWMTGVSCGLKINGRGLLISGIDYQMVGPGKLLHLIWG